MSDSVILNREAIVRDLDAVIARAARAEAAEAAVERVRALAYTDRVLTVAGVDHLRVTDVTRALDGAE